MLSCHGSRRPTDRLREPLVVPHSVAASARACRRQLSAAAAARRVQIPPACSPASALSASAYIACLSVVATRPPSTLPVGSAAAHAVVFWSQGLLCTPNLTIAFARIPPLGGTLARVV
eukprot:5357002-Pleurochrysis_carterae.AAC.2